MSITSKTEQDPNFPAPKDPYKFGTAVEMMQDRSKLTGRHKILYNKGKYFETSFYDLELMKKVSELSETAIEFDDMIVGSWKKMEDFVIAMNIFGYYVKIEIDWI